MLFALILAACSLSEPAPKDSEPDTDGGRAAQAVAVEAKAASEAVDAMVEQVKAAAPEAPVEPPATVIVAPIPAPEKK